MDTVLSVIGIIVSGVSVFISAFLAYKSGLKASVDREKIAVYSAFIEIVYELKSYPYLIFNNNGKEFRDKALSIRARLKLYSSTKVNKMVAEFYHKIGESVNGYKKACSNLDESREELLEELENLKEEFRIPDEWVKKYLNDISDEMRKDLGNSKNKRNVENGQTNK